MIDLYTWPTPNGRKISIMLEELEVPYTVYPININNSDCYIINYSLYYYFIRKRKMRMFKD